MSSFQEAEVYQNKYPINKIMIIWSNIQEIFHQLPRQIPEMPDFLNSLRHIHPLGLTLKFLVVCVIAMCLPFIPTYKVCKNTDFETHTKKPESLNCRHLQHDRFSAKNNNMSHRIAYATRRMSYINCIRLDTRYRISWIYCHRFDSWMVPCCISYLPIKLSNKINFFNSQERICSDLIVNAAWFWHLCSRLN